MWKKQTVEISISDEGKRKISAIVNEGLCIHRYQSKDATLIGYSITHIMTGRTIDFGKRFKSQKEAKEMAEKFFPLVVGELLGKEGSYCRYVKEEEYR